MVVSLLGRPSVHVREKHVPPPSGIAFEVMARIAISGEAGVSRSTLVELFWERLEPANGRSQLRQALVDIRKFLTDHDVQVAFELSENTLRAGPQVLVDLLDSDLTADVGHWLKPVCDGWPYERWIECHDRAAGIIAESFGASARPPNLDQLRCAFRLHPTAAALGERLVAKLKSKGYHAEAEETIIAFETAWVDRFGTGTRPDIDKDLPEPEAAKGPRRKWGVPIAVTLGLAIVGALAATFRERPQLDLAEIEPLGRRTIRDGTTTIMAERYHVPTTESPRFLAFAGGESAVELPLRGLVAFLNARAGIDAGRTAPGDLRDEGHGVTVSYKEIKGLPYVLRQNGKETVLRPTRDRPNFYHHLLVEDGSVLFARVCDHPGHCHQTLLHFADGREHRVVAGPSQIAVFTARDGLWMYGSSTLGREGGWRYRTFRYHLGRRVLEWLDHAPVCLVARDGSLWLLPDVTTVHDGDYWTRWSGVVVQRLPDGTERPLVIEGQRVFHHVGVLGHVLLIGRSPSPYHRDWVALDETGAKLPNLTAYFADVSVFEPGFGSFRVVRHFSHEVTYLKEVQD